LIVSDGWLDLSRHVTYVLSKYLRMNIVT
jgi:hypothetical protein